MYFLFLKDRFFFRSPSLVKKVTSLAYTKRQAAPFPRDSNHSAPLIFHKIIKLSQIDEDIDSIISVDIILLIIYSDDCVVTVIVYQECRYNT